MTYRTLSAKLFAKLAPIDRENLRRRVTLQEIVRREPGRSAHWVLASGHWQGRPIDPGTRAALERISRSGDRAIRVLGRFHDLVEAASHNALHIA